MQKKITTKRIKANFVNNFVNMKTRNNCILQYSDRIQLISILFVERNRLISLYYL